MYLLQLLDADSGTVVYSHQKDVPPKSFAESSLYHALFNSTKGGLKALRGGRDSCSAGTALGRPEAAVAATAPGGLQENGFF
ncbi:unnamed protein product, partial [Amoebophrya sp. A120]|eukprot:GSA120T00006092001.1